MMKIREAIASDVEWLIKEWSDRTTLEGAFPMMNIPAEVEDSARTCFTYLNRVFVAVDDADNILGLIQLDISEFKKSAHTAYLCVIVGKNHRNKGIGTQLIKTAIEAAKNRFHIDVVYLDVFEKNRAVALYKRFGFEECGLEKRFMKEGLRFLDRLNMQKVFI